ncbi:Shewanella-like protein phosphatase 2 [Zea mays]|uniref:Shewanella-like protein phosphatase 2 n=1 Tax=Zea mays TaxID=4577 RepID=A0A3L6FIR9_MAIZE|nr:Shewanella-like protein phosphatase 2 [Zea mays]
MRPRLAALRPDGPISCRFLADLPTVLVVGDSMFVHGGLLEANVEYGLERINAEVSEWEQRESHVSAPRWSRSSASRRGAVAVESQLSLIRPQPDRDRWVGRRRSRDG